MNPIGMWSKVRIILWAHSIASWAAFGVMWFATLREPGRPPLDRRFWLVFGVTEGLAPLWLPLSLFLYSEYLQVDTTTTTVAGTYLLVFVIVAAWRRRCEARRLERARQSSGLCAKCGYDLRASPGRCPECGLDCMDATKLTPVK